MESGIGASGEVCHGMSLHVFSLKSYLTINKVRVAFTYVSLSCVAVFLNRVTLRERVKGVELTLSWALQEMKRRKQDTGGECALISCCFEHRGRSFLDVCADGDGQDIKSV